jgi:UDP-N-acetylmuramyl pentapeptide synthase
VAEALLDAGFATVAASGEFSPAFERLGPVANGTDLLLTEDPEESWEGLREALAGDEVVLVKGSRGVQLERIVEKLARHFGTDG